MASPNPHEEAARLKKVLRLLTVIDNEALAARIPLDDPRILRHARSWGPETWAKIAGAAAVPVPSAKTTALVIEQLAGRRYAHFCPEGHRGCNSAVCGEYAGIRAARRVVIETTGKAVA